VKLSEERLAHLRRALEGRYLFKNLIGRGGSASVFKVRNLKLDRTEALKALDVADSTDEDFGKRFANEVRVAASLDHPGIVKVYDSGGVDGIFWYTMQFVPGPTLSRLLRRNGVMYQEQVARLAVPLLDAFDYSHERGVIHRDIKPSNIVIGPRGRPHLLDYGIAKAADSMFETRTGLILGTPAYVAPEQASLKKLDGRADLYSLGVTLYEALTGGQHFTADNPLQSVVMRVTEDPEPLLKKRADLDPGFAAVIMRALARDPDDRFPSAAAMRDAIIPFVGDTRVDDTQDITATCGIDLPLPVGVTPHPAGIADAQPRRAGRTTRRRWPWVAGGLTAALLVAVALTLYEWPLRGGEHKAQDVIPTVPANVDTAAPDSPAGAGATSLPATTTRSPVPHTAIPKPTTTPTPRLRTADTVPAPPPRRPVIAPRLKADSNVQLPGNLPPVCANHVVNLSVVVGVDGSVVSARMISASPAECGEIAAAAVRTLEYEPALASDQQPIESTVAIAVPFKEVSE